MFENTRPSSRSGGIEPLSNTQENAVTEAAVAHVCALALGFPELPLDSNIFDLGADSIHVTLIVARLQRLYGVEMAYAEVFDHPTVTELTRLVSIRMNEQV
jgi:aryl carrier-like protein